MTFTPSSNLSTSSPGSPKWIPNRSCSSTNHPAPNPNSSRPPEMWSMVMASCARRAGMAEGVASHQHSHPDPAGLGWPVRPGASTPRSRDRTGRRAAGSDRSPRCCRTPVPRSTAIARPAPGMAEPDRCRSRTGFCPPSTPFLDHHRNRGYPRLDAGRPMAPSPEGRPTATGRSLGWIV